MNLKSRLKVSIVLIAAVRGSTPRAGASVSHPASAKPRKVVLSRAEYLDRAKAIWIAQMIGQWTGLQFEHQVASVLSNTPLRPLPGYAPIDDDYYYEMVAIRAFEKYGIHLTVEQLGAQWLENNAGSWGSSEQALLLLIKRGVKPPDTGSPRYNKLWWALEYKPKEPRTHSYMARTADTLLLARETGCTNVGVTIDTGHAFIGGEVVGEAIVLAKRAGNRLFHMHFNDNHTTTDDDMIVATVHSICYIEMIYWLRRCGYTGWLSMDQYPYREDAANAIGESILWLEQFSAIVDQRDDDITDLLRNQDAIATSRFMRRALAPGGGVSEKMPSEVEAD